MSHDMNQSPSSGRYQTRHVYLDPAASQNLKSGTGDLVSFPVVHDQILIEEFGFEIVAAPGAVSVAGVLNLDIQVKDNGSRAIANSLAALTFDSTKSIYGKQSVNLNAGASNSPVAGRTFPLANRGDVLVVEQITQGTGAGAQTVRPWIIYREMPVAGVQG